MSGEHTPEQIAARLTDEQRHALLHGECALPPYKDERSPDCICGADGSAELVDAGLAIPRDRWPNGIIRTALGEQVRAAIQKARG